MKTVAVLGGGVAGLSAAHELVERGYVVTVYEAKDVFGGKARSMPVAGSGSGGREDLPAEHGFRFFPGYYYHLIDTMSRIPTGEDTYVDDNLVDTTRMMIARDDKRPEIIGTTGPPKSWDDIRVTVKFIWDVVTKLGIPLSEFKVYVVRMLALLCSCDERRFGEFEQQSWWDYISAEDKSEPFQKFLASTTSTLVAADARQMSARTGGLVSLWLMTSQSRSKHSSDRVLNGPTSEVWINPWVEYLTKAGVRFHPGCPVGGIHCAPSPITGVTEITGVTVHGPNGNETIRADHYVAALPVERFRTLVSHEIRSADPQLGELDQLVVSWMNGAMFYLKEDKPIIHGHILFPDSEWALTAISQKQFWKIKLGKRGDGRVHGILSVDISEWRSPGRLTGKVAMACSRDEIRAEVWDQITRAIDNDSLVKSNVATWFLDPDIAFPNPSDATNLEPLLINTKGSWWLRPDADSKIPNLFLAADYVRTFTDLATMEAANEAARRAVNAILHADGSTAKPCDVREPPEPKFFKPFRMLDRLRWSLCHRPAKRRLR